ncbi:hypothetical protein IMCC12053_2455 [Celeribacter marinus]|uniref:Uncharacterized protein n=1 Tax=Celeribacter marinus TaxID=1397108 RepID=A0A0P0ADT7_9RHOB|nr:hypothetical protein IMCC12053_2455 [Celeribacter marinus]
MCELNVTNHPFVCADGGICGQFLVNAQVTGRREPLTCKKGHPMRCPL